MKLFSHTQKQDALLPTYSNPYHLEREKRCHFEIHSFQLIEESLSFLTKEGKRSSYFEIVYFTTGHGSIMIDTDVFQIKDKTIFCFVPGQVRLSTQIANSTGYCIRFVPDFLLAHSAHHRAASWLDNYGAGTPVPVIEPDLEMQFEMEQIISVLQKEFRNYFLLRSELLCGLLNILLIHLSRQLNRTNHNSVLSKDNELVHQFKRLLKKDFIRKKQVGEYASDLCVTPNYLNKTVKKITGFTASYHIQQQIVSEAKRQIIHSNRSMKEIAYSLGFDSLAHFSKFFKNNSGINFTSFKKGMICAT